VRGFISVNLKGSGRFINVSANSLNFGLAANGTFKTGQLAKCFKQIASRFVWL